MDAERRLRQFLFFHYLQSRLSRVSLPSKLLLLTLESTSRFLGARWGCIALFNKTKGRLEICQQTRERSLWNRRVLLSFYRNRRPPLPVDLLLSPIRHGAALWGVIALRRDGAAFEKGDGNLLTRVGRALGKELAGRRQNKEREIVDRILRKAARGLRPQDLFYQILHGLRSLVRHDHSAAIYIFNADKEVLILAAEQIAWRKGKSRRIGMRLVLEEEASGLLTGLESLILRMTRSGRWAGAGEEMDPVGALFHAGEEEGAPPCRAHLIAPIFLRGEVVAVVRLSSCSNHRGVFDEMDKATLSSFLPLMAIAMR